MIFNWFELENIRLFRERVHLPLANQGLVVVRGDNRISQSCVDNGCLSGETLIDCPRDLARYPKGIPLRELAGKRPWVYAWSGGRVVVRQAEWVKLTSRRRKVVRVRLSVANGFKGGRLKPPKELIGTADHEVLLADGVTWRALGALKCGDSLCSLYRRASTSGDLERGESILKWTGGLAQVREHRFVASEVWGSRSASYHAHHKNERNLDHRVENLCWKLGHDHSSYHTSKRNREGTAGWKVSGVHPRGMLGKPQTERQRAVARVVLRKRNLQDNPARRPEVRKKISEAVKARWAAKRAVVNHRVLSVKDAGYQPVYDMRVPGADSFVANGVVVHNCGKTGLLHGLSWILSGKDLDGFGAADVASTFKKEGPWDFDIEAANKAQGHGVLEMANGKTTWTVERSCRPTELGLLKNGIGVREEDPKTLQTMIWDAVGWGWLTFRNGIVFGQGNFDRFAAADNAGKMQVFDEIQGLDFRTVLKRAKEWRDKQQEKHDGLVTAYDQLAAKKTQAAEQVKDLEAALETFREGKAQRIKNAENAVVKGKKELDEATAVWETVKERGREAANLRSRWAAIQQAQAEVDRLLKAHTEKEEQVDWAKQEVERIAKETKALLHKGICPTCRAVLKDRKEQERVQKAFAPDLQAAQKKLAESEAKADAVQAAAQQAGKKLEAVRNLAPELDERTVAKAEAEGGGDAQRQALTFMNAAQRRHGEADRAAQAERKRVWEGQAALDAARATIVDAVQKMQENTMVQEKAKRTLTVAEYWVEAFGDRGLRSMLFESNADYLNERLARHLEAFTAGEAVAALSALESLKGGSVRERLNFAASWDWGAAGYKPSSEGQRRRLDLALFLALQDMSEHRSAKPFPLRAWDEPESHLDDRGKEMFCAWVMREARVHGTGLLMTHSPDLAGMLEPDHVWTVILDRSGSRVEVG